jgi:thiamine biosynthesis lipoprotein
MEIYRFPFKAMGSACEIVIADTDHAWAQTRAAQAVQEVLRIEKKYSRYQNDSIVSKINSAAGQASVECDAETWELLNYADQLYQMSEGLFDISSGILRKAWDFKTARVPQRDQLDSLCSCINWASIERENKHIYLPKNEMEIDFGGFGKEYAADKAAAVLEHLQVKHGYVNLGGDIRVVGPKPGQEAWVIGIQHPREGNKIMATIPLRDGALATSGDYEKYFELDGKRYCHILNPRTGMPVKYWSSVSVLAPVSLMAGSYTTIAMLLEEHGLAFLEDAGISYFTTDLECQVQFKK